jgi:sugar lactone lactonase YvrE
MTAPPTVSDAAAPEAPKEPPKVAAPTPVVRFAEGISTPESVLYDEAGDRYLVSNINGKPSDADNNGYIAELSPDGKVTNAKFISGGDKKVKLDAPKGSGIADGIFYVTDIKVVRKFDLKTGAPKGDIPIAGATFLNDIAIGPGGKVYVSDSGIKGKADGGFEPTGVDALYVIEKGKVKPVAKSKDLSGPNGLLWGDKGLLVVTFGANELYRLDDKGAKQDVTKLPGGGLDGLAAFGDSLLVTSWQASAIFKGKLGDKFDVAFPDLKGAADIGIDTKRKRLLVPRFLDNAVEVYELK